MEARDGHHDGADRDRALHSVPLPWIGPAMTRETRTLLAALAAMNRQIPNVALRLLDESMSLQRQLEFGDLLIELGQAMHQHADLARTDNEIDAASCTFHRELGHSFGS
jgi:hypothetical protein